MSLDERIKLLKGALISFMPQEYYNKCAGEQAQNYEFDFHQLFYSFREQYKIAKEELRLNPNEEGEEKLREINETILEKFGEFKAARDEARGEYVSYRNILEKVDKYRLPIKEKINNDKERLEMFRRRFESLKQATSFFENFIKECEIGKSSESAHKGGPEKNNK